MDTFVEISLIIVLATLIAAVMRLFRQPIIIGYIITGLLIGPYFLNLISSQETLETFSEFGIALLLFIVGLHLSPKVVRELGRTAFIAGMCQIFFTFWIGYFLILVLGFNYVESAFIAIGLTFSSTIIVLKLLSDKGDIDKLYGKISVGFLITQDLVACLLLVLIPTLTLKSLTWYDFGLLLAKVVFLAGLMILVTKFILPKLTYFFAKSQEFLFLFALGWGMGIASLFLILGFSIEIGALVAGIILSLFPYNNEISSKLKPLRDFFLVLFFILLGTRLAVSDISQLVVPTLLLSAFVIIGNPLIVFIVMGFLGYRKKISFFTGITMSQLSEFSLILGALGLKAGVVSVSAMSLLTIISVITITFSSYMISFSGGLYKVFEKYLGVFERKKTIPFKEAQEYYDVILFGGNRLGYDFIDSLMTGKVNFLVVDLDPKIIDDLITVGVACEYGDAEDAEFINSLHLEKAKMVISTIPDLNTNEFILQKARVTNSESIVILRSHNIQDTFRLYDMGANYVVMPHFLGGEYASKLISEFRFDNQKFDIEKAKHIKKLNKKQLLGHEHPNNSKN